MGENQSYENLNDIEGLQFIPVDNFKRPIVKNWQTSKNKHDLSKCHYVGLVCGEPSGNIEVVDIDLKYDISGTLYDRFKVAVNECCPDLLKKLVVQKTRSGGYHWIYRCSKIAGNNKLANRPTTEEEKLQTYAKTYNAEIQKSVPDEDAKKAAKRDKDNDKVRVLFETRGIGGQIVVSPSKGYEFVYGDFFSIQEITVEERDCLIETAMSFNEYFEEVIVPKKSIYKVKGVSPFDDYNDRGDIVALLENHGWKIVSQKGHKTVFLRPGETTSKSSGNYDHNLNWFSVFTTSTEFEPQKAYLPYSVFAVLECNKDYSEAAKKLVEMGYGEKKEFKKDYQSTRVIQSRVNVDDNDFSFLATGKDYDEYLSAVRSGTVQMGLSTGFPSMDQYFLFKEGNLVMTNGIDNTGKSVFVWYMAMLSAMYHGWKWIVFSSENTLGSFMRKCIQFYWGKQLYGDYKMNDNEYNIAKEFVETHFKLIKAQEDLFNYKDIINMVKKARIKYPDLKCGMIDPYNSLKIDMSGFSKLSTHEYHYEALSELKSYGQQTKFGWYINNHAVTAALRTKDEHKFPVAPRKEDTEGGGKFANKADDFFTIHRITQHPTDWMITEIHVRKIKDTETGGRPTPHEVPVKFEMYKGGTAFIERLYEGGKMIDPIHEWHMKKNPEQAEVDFKKIVNVENIWKPYKDGDGTEIGF